jgi:hypothetical protein
VTDVQNQIRVKRQPGTGGFFTNLFGGNSDVDESNRDRQNSQNSQRVNASGSTGSTSSNTTTETTEKTARKG